jgi:hypothetical protein
MNVPLYAVIDRRRDGKSRIVSEHLDPHSARAAADLLAWAGDAVEVVLLSTIRDDARPENGGGAAR